MTKAEAPKFFIPPLLRNQTPQGDAHCRVTEALEDSGAECGHSFLTGVFLRAVAAANISKSMKDCSSLGFLGRGPQPVLLLLVLAWGDVPPCAPDSGTKCLWGCRCLSAWEQLEPLGKVFLPSHGNG